MHGQLAQHLRYLRRKSDPPSPRGTWGNFGETRGGRGKVAFWRTKAAISLKRVKTEEKLLWTDYRNSQTLFRIPFPTPYGIPLCGHRQGQPQFLDTSFTLGPIPRRRSRPTINLSRSTIFGYPLLTQEGVKLRTYNLSGTFIGCILTKSY